MKLLSDPQILSGFVIEDPFEDFPRLTHCGEALCVAGHALAPHRHSVFELLVMTRGHAHWEAGGALVRQNVGDVFVALPDQLHATGARSNPENHHLWMGVDFLALGKSGHRLAKLLHRSTTPLYPLGRVLEPLIRGIIGQAVNPRPMAAAVVREYLRTAVALFLQGFALDDDGSGPVRPLRSLPIQRALGYMERNLGRFLHLDEMARVASMRSASRFCDRFRREVGQSPGAMHLRMRLDAARTALEETRDSITIVAGRFGFSSSQHFSVRFKEAYGQTPSSWKNRHRR